MGVVMATGDDAAVEQLPPEPRTPNPKPPVLVVGSLGLDSLKTPAGEVHETLGGTGAYFALAASLYTQVWLVAVVGTDFPTEYRRMFADRSIDLQGLEVAEGRTFRWAGEYASDLNVARTLDIQLNVFADFHPRLPTRYRDAEYVFLANIQPSLQLEVLEQVRRPKFVAVDSRDFWIETERDALTEVIKRADLVLLNDAEAKQYAAATNAISAGRRIRALGPRAVIVKKGEHGAILFSAGGGEFAMPAYPHDAVADPTGAGDSFAGAAMGYLAGGDDVGEAALRRAVVHGSAVASFTVEEFGVRRLERLTMGDVLERYEAFRRLTEFED